MSLLGWQQCSAFQMDFETCTKRLLNIPLSFRAIIEKRLWAVEKYCKTFSRSIFLLLFQPDETEERK